MHLVFVLAVLASTGGTPLFMDAMVENAKADAAASGGVVWSIVVAGSHTWSNYRHQADVYHAYHTLREHGIPDSRIVTMFHDDIAGNLKNPYKGVVYNRPNGPNVYEGVAKDWTKDACTSENFVALLQQEAGASGRKVIKSGPNDHVFVYFADHGGFGLLCFSGEIIGTCSDGLHLDTLNKAIQTMHSKNLYKRMTFYVEACNSGSMFKGLPSDLGVYAITAASPYQSSFATYGGYKHLPYLGDLWSVSWLEDSDSHDLSKFTLEDSFNSAQNRVNTSFVCQYGDLSFVSDAMSKWVGNMSETAASSSSFSSSPGPTGAVSQWDVPLVQARARYEHLKTEEARLGVERELRAREYADEAIQGILDAAFGASFSARLVGAMARADTAETPCSADGCTQKCPCIPACEQEGYNATSCQFYCCDRKSCDAPAADPTCLRDVYAAWEETVGVFTDYSLKHTSLLALLCFGDFHGMDPVRAVTELRLSARGLESK